MRAKRSTNARGWLKAAALVTGLTLLLSLLQGCGEGTLPPPPPPQKGTINLYGEAV